MADFRSAGARIKSVYGKPLSRMAGRPLPIDPKFFDRVGQTLVDAVVAEARKDFAKEGRSARAPGAPVGLPNTEDIFKSFSYRISGKSTVELLCDWPYIDQITQGRRPFPMTWLTQEKGAGVVPIKKKSGVVIFRMAPPNAANAWIHPGFARHNFVQRGIRKGREQVAALLSAEVKRQILKTDVLL